jgi:hypothetical protein
MSALRPSNLPKLAECPCFEPSAEAGASAARGSFLDAAFRAALIDPEHAGLWRDKLTADEDAGVRWAADTVRSIAGTHAILAREKDCRLRMLGLEGTADALVPALPAIFDLKSGARRNYREQLAAYALGLMDAHFAESCTGYLLFCDHRDLESHTFTRREAERIVSEVIAASADAARKPSPCEYCSWCALAATCPARRELAAHALEAAEPGFDFEAVLADDAALSRFLAACSVLEDFRDRAKAEATARLRSGGTLPGWRLVSRQGSEYVEPLTVGHHIAALGFGPVLEAYGHLSGARFRQLWAERMGGQPFPEDAVKRAAPVTYLRQTKPAKQTRRAKA